MKQIIFIITALVLLSSCSNSMEKQKGGTADNIQEPISQTVDTIEELTITNTSEDVNSIHVMPEDSSQYCNYYENWLKKDGEYYREYYDSIQQIILGRNNRVVLDSFGIRILEGELVQAHDKERLKILYLAEASNAITSGMVTDKGEIEQMETIYAFPDSIELSTEYISTNEFNYLLAHQSVYEDNKMDDVDVSLSSMIFLFDQSLHLIEVVEFENCN